MPIKFGYKNPSEAEFNGTQLSRIYIDDELVYHQPYIIDERNADAYQIAGVRQGETLEDSPSLPCDYNNKKVTAIGTAAFKGRSDIKNVNIPSGYTSVGGEAFSGCKSLEVLTVPKGCYSFAHKAFENTTIKKVNAESLSEWMKIGFDSSTANPLCGGQAKLYINEVPLTTITLNDAAKVLAYAFYNCSTLQSVTFPTGASAQVGYSSFENTAIIEAYVGRAYFSSNAKRSFANCQKLLNVNFLSFSGTKIPEETFYGCMELVSVKNIPKGVTAVGENAFYDCRNLASIELEGVETIEAGAFYNCLGLKYIVLPTSLTTVGEGAFKYATGLVEGAVYYMGKKADWDKLVKSSTFSSVNNSWLTEAPRYYYSESDPVVGRSNYWHYQGGIPTVWKSTCDKEGHNAGGKTATCTEGVYCTVCEGLITAPLGHDYKTVAGKAATCTEGGWTEYQVCERCGDTQGYTDIPALGHAEVPHDAKAATCTEIGWNAYVTCSRCNYTTYEEIAALGHDYKTVAGKAATCTEGGWTEYQICSRCGDTQGRTELPALGHSRSGWITDEEATCTDAGSKHKECTECKAVLETAPIPILAHTESDWIIDEEATCTDAGSKHKECTVCKTTLNSDVIIPATGHSFKLEEETATGRFYNVCACGSREEVAIFNYTYLSASDSYAISVNAILKLKGRLTLPSSYNGKAVTGISASGFANQSEVTELIIPKSIISISADAFSGCGKLTRLFYEGTEAEWANVNNTAIISAIVFYYSAEAPTVSGSYWYWEDGAPKPYCGHNNITTYPAVAATCYTSGNNEWKVCNDCKETLVAKEIIAPLGHTPSGVWIIDSEATCSTEGWRHQNCSVCGSEAIRAPILASHADTFVAAKTATCQEVGWSSHTKCSRCNRKIGYVESSPLGHAYESIPRKLPTCTESGWDSHTKCSRCGNKRGYKELAPAGHIWGAWVIDIEPTETKEGKRHKIGRAHV